MIKGVNGKKHHENIKRTHKECYLYNPDGSFHKWFESNNDTAKYLNCHFTSVSACIRGITKTVKGYKASRTKLHI